MRFSLDDIDITLSPTQGDDGVRLRPSSAEFMAYITVEVVTILELEAVSRSVEKSEPRPHVDDFTPDYDKDKQIPAVPEAEGYGDDAVPKSTAIETCAASPVNAEELQSVAFFEAMVSKTENL